MGGACFSTFRILAIRVAKLAIINQEMTRRYWPNMNPIGENLSVDGGPTYEIVGIAGNARNSLDTEPEPQMYCPYWQESVGSLSLLVQTFARRSALAPSIRSAVAGIDPNRAISNLPLFEGSSPQSRRDRFDKRREGRRSASLSAVSAPLR